MIARVPVPPRQMLALAEAKRTADVAQAMLDVLLRYAAGASEHPVGVVTGLDTDTNELLLEVPDING